MLKALAVLIGILLIVVGILGFVPTATPHHLLLGIFMVDPLHNLVHIITGVIALFAATSANYARLFFQVFGVIYAILTILGFALKGDLVYLHLNMADSWLHLVIAIVFLLIGFGCKKPLARTY